MKSRLILSSSIIAATLAAGCVIAPPGPGDKPGAVPPRIVTNDAKQKTWDNPGAFGPVPAELKAKGDAVCAPLNAMALGYHPQAQDESGKPFPGGGYYCVLKEKK